MVAVILWLVQSQALMWSTLVGVDQEMRTATMVMMMLFHQQFSSEGALWLPLPLPMLLVLGAAAAFFLILTRRIRIGSGPN